MSPLRFLVVDDHPLFREIIEQHLNKLFPDASVFHANGADEALGVLRQQSRFDLILLDICMPGHDGEMLLPEVRQLAHGVPVAYLSSLGDPGRAERLLALGAAGFISKTTPTAEFGKAVKLILNSETYVSPAILAMKSQPSDTATDGGAQACVLSKRQLEVLLLLQRGMPNKSIARHLGCSEGTVKLHVSAILRTLQVQNRTEAVSEALRLGLV